MAGQTEAAKKSCGLAARERGPFVETTPGEGPVGPKVEKCIEIIDTPLKDTERMA